MFVLKEVVLEEILKMLFKYFIDLLIFLLECFWVAGAVQAGGAGF